MKGQATKGESGGRGFGRGTSSSAGRGKGKRAGNSEKEYQHCDHYNMDGHSKETCFKLHRYPNWYKNVRQQKTKIFGGGKQMANVIESPLEIGDEYTTVGIAKDGAQTTDIASIVQQELMKLLKGKMPIESKNQVNFAHVRNFIGMKSYHYAFTMLDCMKTGS